MAKICITGMAGFIGFHLAQKLHSEGHQVIGFDNYNDYYNPELKRDRAAKLVERTGIVVEEGDLRDAEWMNNWIKFKRPDVVMHLAAYAGVRHSMDDPGSYVQNNIVGTHNLIEACTHHGVGKVVYASTVIPSTVGLRFFTVYGPWGRPDMALFDFSNNVVAGKPIKLFNHGDMVRDFTYVDDIVQGINIVINRAINEDNINEVYNIGYGEQVQLVDFVGHIEMNLGRKAIRELVPMHPADTHQTWSDTTKLQALGYKPTTNIKEGVAKFIEWYKEYYNVN
jgi:UDP-glucuronate 4-epimerase